MTPEIDAAFDLIRQEYGAGSIDRVEAMLDPTRQNRHPLQHKARWIMPGLSHRPWHDPYEHAEIRPVVLAFEDAHAAVKAELATAWERRRTAFSEYPHYHFGEQQEWQSLHLYQDGRLTDAATELVPTAARILRETAVATGAMCPLLESFFSTLLPGAIVKPHCDLWNFTINLHFAVDIPDGCGVSVAHETRSWQEGRCLLFDYSFEHEVWNKGTRTRTVLITDLWHPETTIPERAALVALVREIRALTGE
ncbi:aspartyl/asparaginyl beta-hydroxylase domain-containing protein [Actinophytocola sp.]|uniref:aspartyl/asparaginyl beta-hydroxylase domain-containing protein n=1 Tax=Actinophytocola sp. TaxID=1872138 RepID=UPI002D311076|nr:aspartyl/asparaginyl beta-hydroxylase domain-containing protein [Actinophytocola sp.]HYQ63568.1 aspartyl/asparaginyl beta-hydroxylase domain-containing protein [Actinophytocola sp.]